MQQLGDELLAGTALASNDNADASGCHPFDELQHPPHRGCMGHDPVTRHLIGQMISQRLVLLLQALPLDLQIRNLTSTVQGDASQRRDRLEKTPVLTGEPDPLTAPLFLVEHSQIAQIDPSIH